MDDMVFLFDGWAPVARVIFITLTGYVALVLILPADCWRAGCPRPGPPCSTTTAS